MTLKWQRSTHPLLTREVLEDALKSYAPIDHLIISDSKTRAVLLVSSDEHAVAETFDILITFISRGRFYRDAIAIPNSMESK